MRSFVGAVFGLALVFLSGPTSAQDKPVEEGFTALFNGKDLTGWAGDTKGYVVENGAIVCKGNILRTEKEYGDFVFRFEFKLPPGGNNGVGLRYSGKGDAAFKEGMEIQILDDGHDKYKGIAPYQSHGSIYGVAAAKRGHLKPAGEWNEQEIVAHGTKIKVTLNGTVILDADIAAFADGKEKTLDKREDHQGLSRKAGYIGFLGHGDPVAFRNIRVKEIK